MKRAIVFLVHVAIGCLFYGILYILSDTFLSFSRPAFGAIPSQVSSLLALYMLVLLAFPFYCFYFLFPKLTADKNRLYWWLAAICLLLTMPVLLLKLDNNVITLGGYVSSFLVMLLFSVLGALLSSFFRWLEQNDIRMNLEKQQLVSELAMLRLQLNPHFLFNTLHNIDALILREPDTASRLLIRLSAMMRYMLYESRENRVLLKQEIEYIEDYISLQNLRGTPGDFVKFRLEGDPGNTKIAPMLLLPFIENAFKHYKKENAIDGINIKLVVSQNRIFFHCVNSYQPQDKHKDKTSGIGLSTIQRRLALIYPGRHTLLLDDKAPVFDVRLTVDTYED
jgi:two-component system LytT family sensor kinase